MYLVAASFHLVVHRITYLSEKAVWQSGHFSSKSLISEVADVDTAHSVSSLVAHSALPPATVASGRSLTLAVSWARKLGQ